MAWGRWAVAERSSAGYVDTGSVSGAPGATDAERAAWLADKIVAQGDYAKEAAAMLRRWPSGTQDRQWTTLRIACGDGVYIRIRRLDGEVRVYKESPGPTGKRELQRMLTVSIGVPASDVAEPVIWQFSIGPTGPNDKGWCECTEKTARSYLAHGAPFVVRALRVVPITVGVEGKTNG